MKAIAIVCDIVFVLVLVCLVCLMISSFQGKTPSIFGYRPMLIMSGSMEPTIHTSQFVVGKTIDSDELKVGDIAAYVNGGKLIVHRIIDIKESNGETEFIFKGDHNAEADREPVGKEQIKYKIILY